MLVHCSAVAGVRVGQAWVRGYTLRQETDRARIARDPRRLESLTWAILLSWGMSYLPRTCANVYDLIEAMPLDRCHCSPNDLSEL